MVVLSILLLGGATLTVLFLSVRALSVTGTPVYSSSPETIQIALELLCLSKCRRFADLGCGFGRVLGAARRYGVACVGFELNQMAAWVAWLLSGRGVKVHCRDYRGVDLRDFDAVYLYAVPRFLERNVSWFEHAFAPGTKVVAIDFPIPGWTAAATRHAGPLAQPIRLYIVGDVSR
jgi:hypothetical protein